MLHVTLRLLRALPLLRLLRALLAAVLIGAAITQDWRGPAVGVALVVGLVIVAELIQAAIARRLHAVHYRQERALASLWRQCPHCRYHVQTVNTRCRTCGGELLLG